MNTLPVKNFTDGLINKIEAHSIPRGAASRVLNWQAVGDRIELMRGYRRVGSDGGIGKITGLHTSKNVHGVDVTWRTRGKMLEYYDTATEDWIEVGSDVLGDDADGEDVSFTEYVTIHGYQTWLSSPNSSLFKIMTANPGSIIDMYDSTKNFKGYISAILNRLFLWLRKEDKTGVYGSYIDNLKSTSVSSESIGTGDGSTETFNNTLVFKSGSAKRTCFGVTVTDGTETFADNYDGTLTGSAGGTGTINYATGAISVTFDAAPANAQGITADYQWEDSTDDGVADFTKSATRLAGEGFIFRQDVGGPTQSVLTYNDIQYCLHSLKTWKLDIGVDDTTATNRIFRELAGIPNWRAAVATGQGIYYVDDSDIADPQFRLLTLDRYSAQVVPTSISSGKLNLADYRFDRAAATEFDDYILFACRTGNSEVNNRVLVYNKVYDNWTVRNYYVTCFAVNNGALWAGDSLSNNVYELFSGWDDDDSIPDNYYETNDDNLDVDNLKKVKRLILKGLIARDQSYLVYLVTDNGDYVQIAEIEGTGDYVDRGTPVTVGNNTIGQKTVGGGDSAVAYNYEREIRINTDLFRRRKLKYVAQGIGYVSISEYQDKDIRIKSQRLASKYR